MRLEGAGGRLERLCFAEGRPLQGRALFVAPRSRQRSDLALRLGCRLDEDGLVAVTADGRTDAPGVFVAGDASPGIQLAVVAAADGARAAVAANAEMIREHLARRGRLATA